MSFFSKKETETKLSGAERPVSSRQLDDLKTRVANTDLPLSVARQVTSEMEHLGKIDPFVAEFSIGVTYVELLLSLPWFKETKDDLDLNRAETIMASHHYGLDAVKTRILEYLAAKSLKNHQKSRILIVDDEEVARNNLHLYFTGMGHTVRVAVNGVDALQQVEENDHFDVMITDLKMDKMDGLTLIDRISKASPETSVIMVTGYATVANAVDAMRKGATHYLSKPVQLDKLKETVEEVLQKQKKLQISQGPVLCFAGPPGTGKTSIGQAVATSLGRKFIRISMGGLRDEAEIRGHRRTYVGAMPGRIISEIKRAGVNNPCIMLDEIDKIGQDFRGDPASVLLEVLDPEQNGSFSDQYLDVPFDLSGVLFIATANDISKLPGPLLDRLEVIDFSSYSLEEKLVIARKYLLPKQVAANGLGESNPQISDKAFEKLIIEYTQESGVRGLTREIGTICRKLALQVIQKNATVLPEIDESSITSLLGPRKYRQEAADGEDRVGVVTSLVWTRFGGGIMFIEALRMQGNTNLILTGSLGEVLRESAQTALSYIRSNAKQLGIDPDFYEHSDIHVHLPAGAVSKDGPSAGLAIGISLISLLTGRPVCRTVSITGEMTLTGYVLPVGGIREKLLAALRSGCTKVVLPAENREDVASLSDDVTGHLELVYVETLDDAIPHLLCAQ
ncbi:ATP-dependent protease La [Desulfocapsa sulfexigens DSM 10523]|uniref:endopeptidase La n=1 Tax=Desulfocapsa sulfexigens (strain DSM 10523 / SB164P1) TaxID=1167006 RepID=M1PS18_DESSD|nr:endopeptidase La [Desulfocapsa sulfexigens]AGF79156.1 ATP-dependent protease La [Desulfocapsa sulfexigens DSM 10523]